MCTLTISAHPDQCIITMNRDELRTRTEANILHTQSRDGIEVVYPVDKQSNGSWIGVNSQGVVLSLLNRYHDTQDLSTENGLHSRGEIIPQALALGAVEDVEGFLTALAVTAYQPFDLFLISLHHRRHFAWNGQNYINQAVTAKPWFMMSSSSYDTEAVLAYRHALFDNWCTHAQTRAKQPNEVLRDLHLLQSPTKQDYSILMERELSHTKSIVQINLAHQQQSIQYFPEVLNQPWAKPVLHALNSKHENLPSN